MSNIFKRKPKKSQVADTSQKSDIEPPSIRVEETPDKSREGSFRHKAKEKLQDILSIRPSHSRAPSRTPSERASQEYLPVFDATANPSIGDKSRSDAIKNVPFGPLKLVDRSMGSVGSALEVPKLGTEVTLTKLSTEDPRESGKQVLREAIGVSDRQVKEMHTIRGSMGKTTEYSAQSTTVLDTVDSATNFLKPLKAFDLVVKELANVHPYAKVALSVLSWASQAIINQANRDQSIQGLQARIAGVYEFMLGDGRLEDIISMKGILSHVSQVIYECAKFIQVYSQPNFMNRLGKGIFSDTDAAIAKYTMAIDDIMQQFNQSALRDVLITTHHALEDIKQLGDNQSLDRIAYAEGAGLDTGKACLDGTREEIQHEVIDWIDDTDPNAARILWLSGPAGTGKSAIAHSIARAMKDSGALGSCFCFKKGDVNRYTKMLTTISYDLAARDLRLKQVLANVVSRDRSLCATTDITQQWENLIKEPLSATSGDTVGRLVIVIDALDESGDPQTRKRILYLLTKQVTDLPNNIRILITSRPLLDIRKAFNGIRHIKRKSMDDIPLSFTERDIHSYISEQLTDSDCGFSVDEIAALSRKADGLFEWARLACTYIISDAVGLSERERFEILMSMTSNKLLDDVFVVILKEVIGERPEEHVLTRFRSVMRHVLFTFEPLPLEALITMHRTVQPEQDQYDAESTVLRRMGSLLSGIDDRFTPIRPLHSSFHDFLVDKKRSGQFFVDESDAHLDLTLASIHTMQRELRFNICRLESSYLRNSEIKDLTQRVKLYISPQLSYSCRFLGDHVDRILFKAHAAAVLEHILCTEQILYWIETISVLQSMPTLLQCFATIVNWLENNDGCEQAIVAAKDAIKLIQNFGGMISESTPHLYLSALPFLPQDSILLNLLSLKFPSTAKVVSGQLATWPPFGCVLTGHTDIVNSVAFTHDGKWVASGSEDSTIRIWDTEIGLLVAGPFKAHTDAVMAVTFSPDSKLLVSGSKDETICVWVMETGLLTRDPLREHSNWVWSLAFSPSGERFASCSSDKTICIWDTMTGIIVGSPLKGHTGPVFCVAFSPDGQRIISGSDDGTVCIWDANTGMLVCNPLQGHTLGIYAIDFSNDGSKIVSGSEDQTICIWNVDTGMQTCKPLQGHTGWISSIVVSPNGKWILSSSSDHTIQVWDIDTGTPLCSPFKPHTNGVRSVAISPDGKKIASGSWDKTVYIGDVEVLQVGKILEQYRGNIYSIDISPDGKQIVSGQSCNVCVWDIESGTLISGPLVGHNNDLTSVAFSPDGLIIASASEDTTICLWDAKNILKLGSLLESKAGKVWSISFSPNSQQMVSSSADGKICLWDTTTGSQLGSPIQVDEGQDSVWAVSFSPDGEKIVSGLHDGTVSIWDVKTQTQIGSFSEHKGPVYNLAWSPDGDKIVSCSDDNTIIIWDVNTGLQLGDPLAEHTSLVKSVVFSPAGNRIMSGSFDKTIRLWNVNDGQQVGYSLKGHTAFVTSVAFSPSGNLAVSGSYDGTIRVWDTPCDARFLKHVQFSSSVEHSLFNAEGLFKDTPFLEEDWRRHVGLNDDGWIVGPQGRLLLWVPIQLRSLLHTPGTVLIMPEKAFELDLSVMAHGERWNECFGDGNRHRKML